jgi:hypothetical protein
MRKQIKIQINNKNQREMGGKRLLSILNYDILQFNFQKLQTIILEYFINLLVNILLTINFKMQKLLLKYYICFKQ